MTLEPSHRDHDLLDTLTARDLEHILHVLWNAAPEWVGELEYATENGTSGPLCLSVWICGREQTAIETVEDLAERWHMADTPEEFARGLFGSLKEWLT